MHSVMKLTLSKLMSGRSPGELSAGLKQLLKHYVYLQGTQGNQKKVHVHKCVKLFVIYISVTVKSWIIQFTCGNTTL